ncbi:hypothetical protein ACFLY6_02920 [Candidatus Dependentiae bacterium]
MELIIINSNLPFERARAHIALSSANASSLIFVVDGIKYYQDPDGEVWQDDKEPLSCKKAAWVLYKAQKQKAPTQCCSLL